MKRTIEEADIKSIESSKKLITSSNVKYNKEISQHNKDDSNIVQDKSTTYCLTIQIEKVCLQPHPESRKVDQTKINNETQNSEKDKKQDSLHCLICKRSFRIASDLYAHIKEHYTCDICLTEFMTQKALQKHFKIHESSAKQFPYTCHICGLLFETKELIKNHNHIRLDKYISDASENRMQYCESCNISFKNETTFRKHLNTHSDKVTEAQIKACEYKTAPGVVDCVKTIMFTCRICNESLTNISEIDKHTKLHIDVLKSK